MAVLKFTIPAIVGSDKPKDALRDAFYQAKENHYRRLMAEGVPGRGVVPP